MGKRVSAEKRGKEIRRRTRRKFTAEEKILIVLEGLRGEAIPLPHQLASAE
jgi:transposase